MKHLPTWL